MALFGRKKQSYEETFRLRPIRSKGRALCSVIFWLWGLGGLAIIGAYIGSMPNNVGVGTSAYVTAISVFWMGGMLLFGIGALLDNIDIRGLRRVDDGFGDIKIDPNEL